VWQDVQDLTRNRLNPFQEISSCPIEQLPYIRSRFGASWPDQGFGRNGGRVFMQERWLSVQEIAVHLGVNPETIYKWTTRKKMLAHKVGRLWKFLALGIDAWVKEGTAGQKET
jgi:excisionase family DNA binding protein